MKTVSGFPYFEVQFTKDGAVHDGAEVTALQDFLGQKTATDLLLISHGWNNDLNDARDLYAKFLASLRAVLDQGVVAGAANRSFAVLAVLWPSIKFADEQLIPSGAAALGSTVSIAFVQQQLDRLEQALQDPAGSPALQRARTLVPALPNSPKAQEEFANLVRSALPRSAGETVGDEDASGDFLARSGSDLMDRLSKPIIVPMASPAGGGAASIAGAAGGAAGLGQTFSGVLSGARNLLNYSTYYLMKDRAAAVGRGGVHGVLRKMKTVRPDLRVHLVGHSFGGRLVTALAEGPAGQASLTVETLTLLQAAFSHNGFAAKFDGARDGAFRAVVTAHRVTGPIVVTHSRNDRAVGVAYPLASRIAGQDAAALGDENDRFGGLGRNGAQHTPERVVGTLQPVGSPYTFEPGKIYNLNADAIIADHSDICHNEVAFALLKAVVA
jgi:hypothetical protein